MASYGLSKSHFANVFQVVGKTFSFCEFCEIFISRGNENHPESTRDHYLNAKVHLSFCKRASGTFRNQCNILIPETNVDRCFLTKEHRFKEAIHHNGGHFFEKKKRLKNKLFSRALTFVNAITSM